MKKSIYVKINDNYTATVYALEDLVYYVGWSEEKPENFEITQTNGNEELAKEIQTYIDTHKQNAEEAKRRAKEEAKEEARKEAEFKHKMKTGKVKVSIKKLARKGVPMVTKYSMWEEHFTGYVTKWEVSVGRKKIILNTKFTNKRELQAMIKRGMRAGQDINDMKNWYEIKFRFHAMPR